jgi:hypothetical protein
MSMLTLDARLAIHVDILQLQRHALEVCGVLPQPHPLVVNLMRHVLLLLHSLDAKVQAFS